MNILVPLSEGEAVSAVKAVSAVDWWASGQCRNVHNDLIADQLTSGASRANTERKKLLRQHLSLRSVLDC